MTWVLILLLGMLVASSPSPVPGGKERASHRPMAKATPGEDWTVITCDGNLLVDYEKNQVSFFRNVLVKNVRGSIRADRLVLFLSSAKEKIDRVEGEGHVKVMTGERIGTSDKIFYYPDQKKAVMLGKVAVKEGDNVVRGKKIIFYLDREEVEVEDASDMKIVPQEGFDIHF